MVSRDNSYIGSLFLSRLLTADPDEMVANVMSTDTTPIPAHTPSTQVVWEFENRDLLSAPVVDDDFRVLGSFVQWVLHHHGGVVVVLDQNADGFGCVGLL